MNNYSPGGLRRLSTSLKRIDLDNVNCESIDDLRAAAIILEAISYMPYSGDELEEAVKQTALSKKVNTQKRTEAVIERRIRETMRKIAQDFCVQGLPSNHPIQIALVAATQQLMHAKGMVDFNERVHAYNQAEMTSQNLRAVAKLGLGKLGGLINPTTTQAACDWMAENNLDIAAFYRYVEAINHEHEAAPRACVNRGHTA